MLDIAQLCWAGHACHERLRKPIFYGELQAGVRSEGGHKKKFKDTLKAFLKDFGVDHRSWETLVTNRAVAYEAKRSDAARTKHAALKYHSRSSTSAFSSLRATDSNFGELADKSEIADFFIFCQEKPFSELLLKTRRLVLKKSVFLRGRVR